MPRELQDFEGKESGACIAIASGPSLNLLNRDVVAASGITMVACNRAYQAFRPGACKYWFSVNPTPEIVWENTSKWLFLQNTEQFRPYGKKANVVFFHPNFHELRHNSLACNQSGFPTLHLCAALGFKDIYMAGFDFGEGPSAYWDKGHFQGDFRQYYSGPLRDHVMLLSKIVDAYDCRFYNMSYPSLINEVAEGIEIPPEWRTKGGNGRAPSVFDMDVIHINACPHVPGKKCSFGDSGLNCSPAAASGCKALRPSDWEPEKPKEAEKEKQFAEKPGSAVAQKKKGEQIDVSFGESGSKMKLEKVTDRELESR